MNINVSAEEISVSSVDLVQCLTGNFVYFTDYIITDFENGMIEYSLGYPSGRITGTNNVIIFKSLSDLQDEEITYNIW